MSTEQNKRLVLRWKEEIWDKCTRPGRPLYSVHCYAQA
jgi:hypothetical protein